MMVGGARPEPTLRPYEAGDEDAVIALWLMSTLAGPDFLPEEHWRADEPNIRRLMPETETWVIETKGELVAFIALIGDLVGGLFVHPDHWRRGHASALIDHAADRRGELLVEVFEANHEARAFYAAAGFVAHDQTTDKGSGLPMLVLRRPAT